MWDILNCFGAKKVTKIDVCQKKTALKWTWDQLFLLSLGCWLLVTNSEKKKTIFKYGMHTTRRQG